MPVPANRLASVSPPVICSVVSKSHLGFARALVRSFRKQHPQGRAYVLVTDEPDGYFDPAAEEFTVLSLADLPLKNARSLCFRYGPFELCNALKPHLLLHLGRERGEGRLLYLDSDIGVFGDLTPLMAALGECHVLLTPHTTVDYPDDGAWPCRQVLLKTGSYNAGVVGVDGAEESQRFLRWWADALEVGCVVDPERGLFVDQRYLDLVPSLFTGVQILRHDGVNVAHFNLHCRRLDCVDGRWSCNGVPLLLFHFTQVDWPRLGFYARVTRLLLEQQPLLRELLAAYHQELIQADFERASLWPNTHTRFVNGLALTMKTRDAFRIQTGADGQPDDPFADLHWMTEQRRFDARHRLRKTFQLPVRAWNWLGRRAGFKRRI